MLRVIAGEAAVKAMLAAGAPREYLSVTQPLVRLIGELSKRKDCRQMFIEKKGFTLRLEKPQRLEAVQMEYLHHEGHEGHEGRFG